MRRYGFLRDVSVVRILAFGDSLTSGKFTFGFRPYAIKLGELLAPFGNFQAKTAFLF